MWKRWTGIVVALVVPMVLLLGGSLILVVRLRRQRLQIECALAERNRVEAENTKLQLTDGILRGKNGKRLSESLLLVRPKLKILFMSGYPSDVISRRGILAPGLTYIQQPFTPAEMPAKVREVLSSYSQ